MIKYNNKYTALHRALLFMSLFALSLFSLEGRAQGFYRDGDGNAFPHSCVDFSGIWLSKDKAIRIQQNQCKSIKLLFFSKGVYRSIDIDIDGRLHYIHNSSNWEACASRWNSLKYGVSIEMLFHSYQSKYRGLTHIQTGILRHKDIGVISLELVEKLFIAHYVVYEAREKDIYYRKEESSFFEDSLQESLDSHID